MKNLYQKTFDKVSMPEETYLHLRTVLASRCSQNEMEVNRMKNRTYLRRPAAFLVALILIAALSVSALACGAYVVYQVLPENAEIPENENAADFTDFEPDEVLPYEYTEKDGEIIVSFGD